MSCLNFPLKIDPQYTVTFKLTETKKYIGKIYVSNESEQSYALKIKCTDNKLFQIVPAVTIINPHSECTIQIKFNTMYPIPTYGNHGFLLSSLPTDPIEKPRNVFANAQDREMQKKTLIANFDKHHLLPLFQKNDVSISGTS